jgi:hypothetical protein
MQIPPLVRRTSAQFAAFSQRAPSVRTQARQGSSLVPVLIGFGGYRAYVREHERHKKVEFLYQANRSLAESPEVAIALEGLLERAREAFRCERAEVVLFGQDDSPPLLTGSTPAAAPSCSPSTGRPRAPCATSPPMARWRPPSRCRTRSSHWRATGPSARRWSPCCAARNA